MEQSEFDNAYIEGMEDNSLSLTNSTAIISNDLIDAYIHRLYFAEGKTVKEIQDILKSKVQSFKRDFHIQ